MMREGGREETSHQSLRQEIKKPLSGELIYM